MYVRTYVRTYARTYVCYVMLCYVMLCYVMLVGENCKSGTINPLSADAFSMSRGVDKLSWMRLLWGSLVIPQFDWRNPSKALAELHRAIIVTDCKSLFDLATRTAMPSCEEYRTTLEVLLIRELCYENCDFRWIPTSLQLADPLTKPMDPAILRVALAAGNSQLFDEQSSLQANAHRKQAITWLRENAPRVSHQKKSLGSVICIPMKLCS